MKKQKKERLLTSYNKLYRLITVITIVVLIIIISYFLMSFFTDLATADNQKILSLMEDNLNNILNYTEAEMEEVVSIIEDDFIIEENRNLYLSHVSINSKLIETIIVLDANAEVIYSSSSESDIYKFNRSGYEYYTWQLENTGVYWSSPYISLDTGKLTITISMQKNNHIFVGNIDITSFQKDYIKNNLNNKNLHMSIVDKYGKYVLSKDQHYVYERRIDKNFEEIKQMVDSNEIAIDLYYDNQKYLVSTVKMERNDWYITILNSYENVNNLLQQIIIGLFGIMLLLAAITLIISSITSKKITDEFVRFSNHISEKLLDYNSSSIYESNYEEINLLTEKFTNLTKIIIKRDNTLKDAAYKDSLTGLFGRSYSISLLGKMINSTSAGIIRVIYIDLDNFKYINDTMGHMVGDEVLISYAKRLKKQLPKDIIISRIGGDEFLIIYRNKKNISRISSIVESIKKLNEEPIVKNMKDIYLTNSIGVATYPTDAQNANDLLKCADTAMYESKNSGKNQAKYYNYTMSEKIKRKSDIRQSLNKALDHNEFDLVYQPIVEASTHTIRGFEALLRWESINLGLVSPIEFIPIAEESGLIQEIGEWVISKSIRDISYINNKYNQKYIISINISPIQIKNRLLDFLKIELETNKCESSYIELEITEGVDIYILQDSTNILNKIKDLGIKISMDDFGTGFSSLSYINKLPLNTIKIDKYFVQNSEISEFSRRIISTVESIANSLNLDIIAEGIETKEQYQYFAKSKCNYLQGYYISHPLSLEGAEKFVNKAVTGVAK